MSKPDLLLLHGTIGASEQFSPLAPILENHFRVHALDFEGHGLSPMRGRPFRIEHFAEDVIEYLDLHSMDSADLFGYSMGGYVALHLAATQPGRVKRAATLGTKFEWTPEFAAREAVRLDAKTLAEKVPRFATMLEARHVASGWETVLARTADLLAALGERPVLRAETLKAIPHRVRICVGDRDTTVSLEESAAAYRLLPQGELAVLPDTPHPLEKVSVTRLVLLLTDFFRR